MIGSGKKERFVDLVAVLFIALFAYASVNKLIDIDAFRMQLGKSPLLADMTMMVAWSVPAIEICIAMLLAFNLTRTLGLYGALFLMSLFTWYIIAILNFSEYVPCSCGGILGKLGWTEHLIFNVFFLTLALLALASSAVQRTATLHASFGICVSTGFSVSLLFLLTYDDRSKYSTFDRKFLTTPIETDHLDLEVNSYYFAGQHGDSVYMGNLTNSRIALSVDTALIHSVRHLIAVPNDYSVTARLRTHESTFFMFGGSTPNVYTGRTDDWSAQQVKVGAKNISEAVPFSSTSLISRSLDGSAGQYILEGLSIDKPPMKKTDLLQKQVDGLFCVDGMMATQPKRNLLVYLYYYRNQFVVTDTLLRLLYRGNTVDTISKAKINVVDVGKRYHTVASIPLFVNKLSCASDGLLFVSSGIRARNQSPEDFASGLTIDIYDLERRRYKASFKLENRYGKVKDMFVAGRSIFILAGRFIVKYDISAASGAMIFKDILQGL